MRPGIRDRLFVQVIRASMQMAGMRNVGGGSTGSQPQAAPDMAGLMAMLGQGGGQGIAAAGNQNTSATPASLSGGANAGQAPGAFDPSSLLNTMAALRALNPQQQGQPDLTDVMAMLGGLGGAVTPVQPVANPEEVYYAQLQQLSDMGFFDREKNIQALQACGGNVHAAVERLLT
jgi:hypothetical protein